MTPPPPVEVRRAPLTGIAYSAAAYALWGMFPIYFKAVSAVPAVQVLAHRIVWSLLLLAVVVGATGGWRQIVRALAERRLLVTLSLSATLIAVNWGVFIWAVAHARVLECSLGYFINPIVSVLLGVTVLRERLGRLQWMAVALAAAGVAHEIFAFGSVPWVALTLAGSFGAYGLLRKTAAIDPVGGLFVEAALLTPAALAYLVLVTAMGEGAFAAGDPARDALLAVAGPLTALPLILFVAGARRIRLATVGLLQYIAPTGHFVLAVAVYGEPFSASHLTTFACIWSALALYSLAAIRRSDRRRA